MKAKLSIVAVAAALGLSGSPLQAADTVIANNGVDLAAKITMANANSQIGVINCVSPKACSLTGTLPTFTGSQRLVINGKGSTIDATGITGTDVFSSDGGGKLKLKNITFIGGMSGIYVEVPADKTTVQLVELQGVTVQGADLHGVFIKDGEKAPASIKFIVRKSKVMENGFGDADQNGMYVDETGDGRVSALVEDSVFRSNASNGFSIFERGRGEISVTVTGSAFLENGENPNNPSDPDDGLDLDERGGGRVSLTVSDSRFNLNSDDGIDIDEAGSGSLVFDLTAVKAVKNLDQGIAFEEELAGNLVGTITDSRATGNDAGSQGINMRGEQSGSGSGSLTLDNTLTTKISMTGIEVTRLP